MFLLVYNICFESFIEFTYVYWSLLVYYSVLHGLCLLGIKEVERNAKKENGRCITVNIRQNLVMGEGLSTDG